MSQFQLGVRHSLGDQPPDRQAGGSGLPPLPSVRPEELSLPLLQQEDFACVDSTDMPPAGR